MKSLLTLIFIWTVFASGTLRAQKLFEEANDDLVRQIDRMYKQGQGYLAKSQSDGGNWSDNSY
ncbi:MAG: squalene--hopene cyclase, partial [Opitutae bacterium]|nr:squalene--hopene cyclase [Opitutae bacterium]